MLKGRASSSCSSGVIAHLLRLLDSEFIILIIVDKICTQVLLLKLLCLRSLKSRILMLRIVRNRTSHHAMCVDGSFHRTIFEGCGHLMVFLLGRSSESRSYIVPRDLPPHPPFSALSFQNIALVI